MKTKLFTFLAVFGVMVADTASASLWSYYDDRGLELPTLQERIPMAESCGIENYSGTPEQNLKLEKCITPMVGARIENSGFKKKDIAGVITSQAQDDIEVVDLNNADLSVTASTTLQDLIVNGIANIPSIIASSTFTNTIFLADGTYTNPSVVFTNDTDTGFYRVGSGEIGFTSNETFAAIFANDKIKTNNFVARNSIPLNVFGQDASDGSGIGVKIGNTTNFTTAGDRLVAFYNNNMTDLKSYIDKDGNLYGNGALTVGADTGEALTLAGAKAQVTPTTLTTGSANDFGIGISQSLNDSSAAGGTDTYRMIKGVLTETDTTGWNDVYLMDLMNGADSKFAVKSDGKVGIGTDSPDEIFHIQSDDDADIMLEHNRVDGNPLFIFNRSGGTGAAKTIIPADDVLGGIVFSGYDGTEGSGGAYINGATIFARLDGTAGTEDMPTKLEFATTPDGTNSSVVRQTIYNDGIFEYNGLKEAKSSETVADEGTITLAVTVAGNLKVWTDGGNYLEVYVDTDGTVTQLVANGSTATTDSDTNLCVYDGGTGAVIKNRLGASKVVRYIFNYSTN